MLSRVLAVVVFGSFSVVTFAQTPVPPAPATQPADLVNIASWKGAAPHSSEAFTFAILSDRSGGTVPGRWEQAIREVNRLRPDFVMFVGDLLAIGNDPEDSPTWKTQAPSLGKVWQEAEDILRRIDAPFFFCPGNHDVGNETLLQEYLRRHATAGKTYYSFDYRDCHFVVLDTVTADRKPDFAAEQADWFAKDMARAAGAKHVFLFWHYPIWKEEKLQHLWKPLRQHIDPAKTTIFNGHYHSLSYGVDCDVPTYILGSTGTGIGDQGRAFGSVNMFALVSVDQGKPSLTMLPLGAAMDHDYAIFATKAAQMTVSNVGAIPLGGGAYGFKIPNLVDVPVSIAVAAQAPDWSVEPAQVKVDLAPGKSADLNFQFKPLKPSAPRPVLNLTYSLIDPANQKVESKRVINISQYRALDVRRIDRITIDGDLSDWSPAEALKVDSEICLLPGKSGTGWRGADDGSYALRVAHDDHRLYLAVQVRDDQVIPGPTSSCDTLAMLWDVRPPEQITGEMDERTGYLILHLPEGDGPATVDFASHPGKPLKDFKAVCKRMPDGYVFEIAMPLAEVGMKTPVQTGSPMRLEVQLSDQDKNESTLMNSSGTPGPTRSSAGYLRCTLR